MNAYRQVIEQTVALANARTVPQDGDYIGPDGLLICGKCGTPKQCRVNIEGVTRKVGCLCKCATEHRDSKARELAEAQKLSWKRRLKRAAIQDSMLRNASFEAARPSSTIEKAKNYVRNWEQVRENNVGLLLMGSVGVGKSYAAACICNALLDRGIRCYMTSFGRILSMEWEDRARFLSEVSRYELLVLDDFGAERNSEFADEIVFSVIDERYRAQKPLIVTTNLGLPDLKNPSSISKGRIYDRLLEICGPVLCEGENFRKANGNETRRALREVLEASNEATTV